mmetsp:Transcript_18392/g.56172  ORF Transcript_18392/g.56172 Transcript_18392/m.56172 type:complete len:275 (-) Transcript_18392:341-1165(-)|eukprot:CAMPEP_0118857136 /NCGR_PEP_ID=MMETSP1163-20130328/4361_1 /TAXON_ID=124430 /ORGANISM="Phaeomonas parva, Strain CCMP2877" /LENGTH=274 /DNA_ID=CAMNT_0006790393 /DNA_START=65 /DNA_END=889 /DNA_ORIENTATION=+
MEAVIKAAGGAIRAAGKAVDKLGAALEVAPYFEHLNPSTRVVAFEAAQPKLHGTVFVAPTATVLGNVSVAESASIWYGAVVRGDVNNITIGPNSSIGDRSIVHVAKIQGDAPTHIGANVTVGPNTTIHACTLKDKCVIGAAASVLDNSVVETHAMVAPGSIVTMGVTVPSGQLWAGVPARFVRELTPEEIASIDAMAAENAALAEEHRVEQKKKVDEIVLDQHLHECDLERDPAYGPRLDPAGEEWKQVRVHEPPAGSHEEIYYGPGKTATRFN